jgi:hypothetical protein
VKDTEGNVRKDCDGNQARSLCCEKLEDSDEDHSVAHTSQNGASRSPRILKTTGKEEKYTAIDKVFIS